MIPEGNNVYAQITAPKGLKPVLQAVWQIAGEAEGYIYRSGFNGARTLHVSTANVDFESTPLDNSRQHLLTGAVGGSLEEVTTFVRSLSAMLADLGIENSFEVYDDERNLIQLIQPEGQKG